MHKLTPTQRDLFLHHVAHPHSTQHLIADSCHLDFDLDADTWRRAVEIVLSQEPLSKTYVSLVDGNVEQRVGDGANPEHIAVDLADECGEAESAEDFIERDRQRPFDLYRLPLWRAYLIRNRDRTYVAALMAPHIFADGWTFKVLFERIGRAYERLRLQDARCEESSASKSFLTYADEYPGDCDTPDIQSFWSDRLSGLAPLGLPKRSGSVERTKEELLISALELKEIRQHCRRNGYSFVGMLRAVYSLIIRRMTGETSDLAILDIVDTRPSEFSNVAGCFFRTLPIVAKAKLSSGNQLISDLIKSLDNQKKETENSGQISSLALQRIISPGSPKYFFNFYVFETVKLLGRERDLHTYTGYGDDEIHFVPSITTKGLRLKIDYPADWLPRCSLLVRISDTIRQIKDGVQHINKLATLLPGEPSSVPSILECEREPFRSVIERIGRHASNHPDAIALSFGDAELSYGRLDQNANQLAHHLIQAGVRRNEIVALHLDKSTELIVAMLAVLKAGAAYLPLDVSNPSARLRDVLTDSCPTVIISTTTHIDTLSLDACAKVVFLDRDVQAIAAQPDFAPRARLDPRDPAYVIYTSGSTGRPKGVVISHDNLVALLDGTSRILDFSSADVWTMAHSPAFDFSVWEVFGALSSGGQLVIVPSEIVRAPEQFLDLLCARTVTVLSQTPSAFAALSSWQEALPQPSLALRYVIFGGEALQLQSLVPWIARYGDTKPALLNMYGITETTVHVTAHYIHKSDCDNARGASIIGRPIPGWTITLRDQNFCPVPPNGVGEIFVGGRGVARGYLNRPSLETEKFVTLPDRPGERYYRSGDLARANSEGDLEYIGRSDTQFKIRGFRIERGEIEAAFLKQRDIQQVAVVAVNCPDPRLVAYVVVAPGYQFIERDIRERLMARLPMYMLPWRINPVVELPRTLNGKLDETALKIADHASAPDAISESLSPLEAEIAEVWRGVLGLREIKAQDHFFDLGGNSLLATQMILRLRERFDLTLPLCTAFQFTTVQMLAVAVEDSRKNSTVAELQTARASTPPRRPDGPGPLTFAQERAWFIEQLYPQSVAYHFTANLTWTGRLDVAALSAALTELVSRHEVLRTTFEQVDGLPRQRVHPPWFVKLESHPASYLEIESWTAQESRRPFNLGSLPLIRWHLFQISENEHQLIHIEHHLLHDGWSFAVLLRELFAIYECLIKKEAHSLEPPDWQPSDIAMKERQWIGTEDAKKQLSFWSRSLEKIPKILDLPTDHVRPSSESFAGDAVRFSLDAGLAKKIEDFNRQRGLTLHMTLRAIFEALVHRLTGSKHFIIGSGTANRATSALENSVGMILNNLALPADVSGEPNLEELVSRVRATAIAALDNQAIPFDHVVKAVDTERSAQRTPLCQVFFSSYDGPIPNFGLRDVTVETRFGVNNGSAKFDLNVIVIALPMLDPTAGSGAKASKSIEMIWEYKTDLFTQETIKRWGSCFEKLLETALANPNTSITRLPIMPDAEKEKTLVTFNQTQREYPRKATINQLFESIAKAHPDREAIVYKERSLTYRELDDMAEAIVSEMSSKGISLGSRVGVCLNRSPEAIATILGVLKAGAVYVPINPNDPRRTVLADRAGLKLIISEDGWTVRPEPEPDLTPSEPAAYIMFTSGSTGEPKGVLVTHQNVVRLVQGTDFVRFGPDEVFLQLSPLTFDASTFEIWGALLHGSKLVLWPDQAIETVELRNMIRQHGISTLWLTSSLLHVVAQDNPNILNGIRQLIAGGDVLHPHDLAEIRKCFPDLRMVNGYGPTECTTFSCCYVLPSGTISDAAVPIGSPIANTTAYVLSDCFEPQPLGIPGELFIGGDGVALGYIGEPALTAEKFVSDPWGRPNGRLYRTGDRVRWLPTGVLEFIGRLDRQVKVRGYRIEPAEVERIMASLPGVRDVAVSTPPDDVSGHRLHAFLVTDNSSDAASIRAKLIDRVPDFMIPSGFTFLEELPLGPTGKVDRSRLVVPKPPVEEHLPHLVVARSATEERLARIWERLLGSNHVSVNDPFFDIGGHSLLALKLVHEINLQFNLELPVRFVINEVTISRQAKAIDHLLAYTNPRKISFPIVVALREEGHRKPFFLVAGGFGGEAELLVYAKLTDHLDPEQPFYGLRIPGVDDLVEPASIEEIAAQHVREIQAIQPTGPYQIGGSCIGGVVAFEIAQQLLAQGQTISRLVLVDSRYPSKFWYYRYVARRAVADFRDQKTSIFRLMKKPRGQDIPSMKNHIGKSYLRRTLRYRPRPYPGKIVLIISEAQRRRKPARVWIQLAKKGLDLRYVPGDHFSHLRQYACETGRQITECLRNSDGEQKRGVATQSRQPNVQSKVSLG